MLGALLAAALTLTGPATVTDGDSLRLSGQRIRLYGIDAPELRQRCGTGAGWPCGRRAKERLEALTAGTAVTCVERDRDRYGRIVAVCTAAGRDLGAVLVREGLAVAFSRYSRVYEGVEAEARQAKRGMWSGPFERPEDWRRR